jgi:hypothetical protein
MIDALATGIQAGGGARVSLRGGAIGAAVEMPLDPVAPGIQPVFDALAARIQAAIDAFARIRGEGGGGGGGGGGQQYGQAQRDAAVHVGGLVVAEG